MAERALSAKSKHSMPPNIQKKSGLRIGAPDDEYEREADRIADAVINGGGLPRSRLSLNRIPITRVQREEAAKPKSEEEKYKEAALKVGEAFLKTELGKKLKEKVEEDALVKGAEDFVGTLPGKVVTGAAAIGAVSALAATHKELPAQIPEIPLDRITPGLKVKITYEGPVDKPTKAMIAFSYVEQVKGGRRPAKTKSEIQREENARMAAEMAKFRAGMRYAPGTPEAKQQAAEEEALKRAAMSTLGHFPEAAKEKAPLGAQPPAPFQLRTPAPSLGFKPKPISLLDEKLKLKTPDQAEAPKEEEKKKDEGDAIQRKATADGIASNAPAGVRDALQGPGRPLDTATRTDLQRRLGCNLAHVRIHTDVQAERSAQAISARAYTVGNEVVFASGQYSPYTSEGRRLLVHELAHVVQQEGLSDAPSAMPVIRRKGDEQVRSPAEILQAALKGDDDSVRDLTKSPQWSSVSFTPEQATALLVLLLVGATLDDDEIAGLAILQKTLALGVFDETLGKLNDKGRFKQLLDDYHGDEYRLLLDLLSNHIERLNIKAIYLDAFIAMWWVREHEERAIVVLLERTTVNDLFALLTKRDRQKELRDAIDTDSLSIRYEQLAAKVNEMRQTGLAAQLRRIFDAKAKASQAAGKRTPDDVNRLLAAAAVDLALELHEYRQQLAKVLKNRSPDANAIAEINKEFEIRLDDLVEMKGREFDYELKYNVEFNRRLFAARSRSWTESDLKEMDNILAQIPPAILHAAPKFEAFLRAERDPADPGVLGRASEQMITLFGPLSLGTTEHELGHVISYDDKEKLLNEFSKRFVWETLTLAQITSLVPDREERRELLENLETDRKDKRREKAARHSRGNYYYRYYYGRPEEYLRHPKNACFISDYAATGPGEDFAESFQVYLDDPVELYEECPDKYAFMRGRVFVGYFFGKQVAQVLSDFDKDVEAGLKGLGLADGLPDALRTSQLKKLRSDLENKLSVTEGGLETRALREKPHDKMKRIPLTGAEARDVATPYRQRLSDFFALFSHLSKPYQTFSTEAAQLEAAAPKQYKTAAGSMRQNLAEEFRGDVLALINPYAKRIITGEHIQLTTWPEMDAVGQTYRAAFGLASKYLPMYESTYGEEFQADVAEFASTEKGEVGHIAWNILSKYPQGDPSRQKLKTYMIGRRYQLQGEVGQLRLDIAKQAEAGISPESATRTPEEALKSYQRDIEEFIEHEELQLQRQVDPSIPDAAMETSSHESVLHSSAMKLPGRLRAEMELCLGYDLSNVRVHTGTIAEAAAQKARAKAYTVGSHMVFGSGRYEPGTLEGRRLIAHELAHVLQQTEGRDLGTGWGNEHGAGVIQRSEQDPDELASIAKEDEAIKTTAKQALERVKKGGKLDSAVSMIMWQLIKNHRLVMHFELRGSRYEKAQKGVRLELTGKGPATTGTIIGGDDVLQRVAEGQIAPVVKELESQIAKVGTARGTVDYVFIMGADLPKSKNKFYTEAKRFFKAEYPNAIMVEDVRDLQGIIEKINSENKPVANLNIVSHAHPDGTLQFSINPADKTPGQLQYSELKEANEKASLSQPKPELVGFWTNVLIRGCNLGRNEEMLKETRKALGGAARVIAPTHEEVYGGGKESLGGPFYEEPGISKLSDEKAFERIKAKAEYGFITDWKELHSKLKRFEQSIPEFVYEGSFPVKGKELELLRSQYGAKEAKEYTFDSSREDGSQTVFTFNPKDPFKRGKVEIRQETPPDDKTAIELARRTVARPDAFAYKVRRNRSGLKLSVVVDIQRTEWEIWHGEIKKKGKGFRPSIGTKPWFGDAGD